MKKFMRGTSAAAVIVVAAWGLCTAPAGADGEPTTTPTITAPTDGATVAGDVQISAASAEVQVQFYEDGVAFGTPVATSGGVATTTWSTWGVANGAAVAWTAADCNLVGCNATQSTAVSVNVLNEAPVITAPADGAVTDPLPTLTATSPGGALSFKVDDTVVGVASTAPYSEQIGTPLPDGAHTLTVQECDATGTQCSGPTATSNFTVVTPTLNPTITSVAPNPFSPRVDGRNDIASFRVHLPDAESVTWTIKNSLGQTVNGPHNAGLLGAGDHVFNWNGHNNVNQIVGDRTYTIVVTTSAPSGALTLHGSTSAPLRVDDTPSVLHLAAGNGATFYPVVDGFVDTFGPTVTVNEGGTLWLQVYTTTGTLVMQIAKAHAGAGTVPIVWNGRNRGNVIAAQGTFRYRFLAQDLAGNRSATALGTVYLSHRYLVTKVATITRPANPASLYSTDTNCAGASYNLSAFAHGVVLANVCDSNVVGPQIALAEYLFNVPAAIRYNSIRLQSVGRTDTAPEQVTGLIYNYRLQQVDLVGNSPIGRNGTNLTCVYGTVAAAGRVNASRQVDVAIALGDGPGGGLFDYDFANVSVVVSYSVLN